MPRIYTIDPPKFCPYCGARLTVAPRAVMIKGWFELFCDCKPDPFMVADDCVKLPSAQP